MFLVFSSFLFLISLIFLSLFPLSPPRLDFSICGETLKIELYCIVDVFLIKFVVVVDILVVTRTEGCHFAEISRLNQGVILLPKIVLSPSHRASQQTNSGRVQPTFELSWMISPHLPRFQVRPSKSRLFCSQSIDSELHSKRKSKYCIL